MSMSAADLRMNILLACPRAEPGKEWGDQYFGLSLAKAVVSCGADARLEYTPRPRSLPDFGAGRSVDLFLRGKKTHHAKWGRPFFMWVISHPQSLDDKELSSAAHIFAASEWLAEDLEARGYPVSFLPQCTDPAIFSPEKANEELKTSVLFVGNRRLEFTRSAVQQAVDAGFPVRVWGRGWDGFLPDGVFAGEHIPNELLGAYYASASVVLNDHAEAMSKGGFASNRVYDVLASGTELVTDGALGIPEDLRSHVHVYETPNDLGSAITRALERAAGSRAEALKVASRVRSEHTFEERAARIIEQMRVFQGRKKPIWSRVTMFFKK